MPSVDCASPVSHSGSLVSTRACSKWFSGHRSVTRSATNECCSTSKPPSPDSNRRAVTHLLPLRERVSEGRRKDARPGGGRPSCGAQFGADTTSGQYSHIVGIQRNTWPASATLPYGNDT